ncbi:uncharacterized protein LOC110431046 isoform X9 [Sorghum bicolor]|uniref:uncharacterized protein LOC110431046 isoform X9 n=1 Tax=Sorghum bicolor TaxID=4558 RepID=UPI000B423CF3|nr:uncharacterized protein LOC110431046 isoform X9 [Sorghum bicolor]|eukprot:XP_021305360.1 uncharacterized protein LOC110431046 isoform X9 [Sorghum bicolor]
MGATGAPRPPSSSSLPPFPSSVGGGAPGDGVACRRGDDTGLKHLELRFRLHAFSATAATHASTPTTDLAVLHRQFFSS